MTHYYAYGSNLHPIRLKERVPSAELVAVTDIDRHRLVFHKRSHDGSAKCNLHKTGCRSDRVYGAIYEIAPEHKSLLDRYEGRGFGYSDDKINLPHRGREYSCFAYVAQQTHIFNELKPYHWYKKLLVLGARYLQFPDSYVFAIESTESVEDPDLKRRKEQEALIKKIVDFRWKSFPEPRFLWRPGIFIVS